MQRAFRAKGVPRSLGAGGLIFFVIALETSRASGGKPFFRHDMSGCNTFQEVYLLQSLSVPTQRYVGVTTNLEERLQAHNAGGSLYTSKYRPWKVVMYLCFQDDQRAVDFERYLKTGSGQAFANKRLW